MDDPERGDFGFDVDRWGSSFERRDPRSQPGTWQFALHNLAVAISDVGAVIAAALGLSRLADGVRALRCRLRHRRW